MEIILILLLLCYLGRDLLDQFLLAGVEDFIDNICRA
jgi:hypothetical protein